MVHSGLVIVSRLSPGGRVVIVEVGVTKSEGHHHVGSSDEDATVGEVGVIISEGHHVGSSDEDDCTWDVASAVPESELVDGEKVLLELVDGQEPGMVEELLPDLVDDDVSAVVVVFHPDSCCSRGLKTG